MNRKKPFHETNEQQQKISEIILDVNTHLENISKLTYSHMENRGISFQDTLPNRKDDATSFPECKTQVKNTNNEKVTSQEGLRRAQPIKNKYHNHHLNEMNDVENTTQINLNYSTDLTEQISNADIERDIPFIDDYHSQKDVDLELMIMLKETCDPGFEVKKIQLAAFC